MSEFANVDKNFHVETKLDKTDIKFYDVKDTSSYLECLGEKNSILFKRLTLYQIPFLYFLDIYFLYSYRPNTNPI